MGLNPLRKRQFYGSIAGILLGGLGYFFLTLPANEDFLSLGPMNTGHEGMSCNACHYDAKGTLMQQINSNIQYMFGARKESVDFGTQDVDNKKCLACHDRANDRHPTHRFLEPKFQEAIQIIDASECETCHREHNGVRLVLENANFCMNCHSDLTVKNDPLDVSHEELIRNDQWSTCLQCHDFHGNHLYETAIRMKDTIPIKKIMDYLNGGADPFSNNKKYYPLSEEDWMKKVQE